MDIKYFIANASGTLSNKLDLITSEFEKARDIAINTLNASKIDVIFVDAPNNAIKELGVGGYTASENLIYISINSKHHIKEPNIESIILHELHHATRWRKPGFGKTLAEVMITEGLATLFEEESTRRTPIYAKTKFDIKKLELLKKEVGNDKFSYFDWFIGGTNDIPKWFGYACGYLLAKNLSDKTGKTSSELANQNIIIEFRGPDDAELTLT
jgi:uncharacterized protein YjaZ